MIHTRKPASMVISTTALQWMSRDQLSISLGALFQLHPSAGHLLADGSVYPLWSNLMSALVPLDNGYPRATSRLLIYDAPHADILRPRFAIRPGKRLIVDAPHCMTGCEQIDMEMWRNKPVAQRLSWASEHAIDLPDTPIERAAWSSAQLPALRARCFVEVRSPFGTHIRKLDTQLETVALFPEIGLGALVYRAMTPHPDKVTEIVGAWEEQVAPKRSLSAYFPDVNRPGERALEEIVEMSTLTQCASSQLAPLPTSATKGTRNCATPHINSGNF